MAFSKTAHELAGRTIKDVFGHADAVAELHACLTSPRGDQFRLRLLQSLDTPAGDEAIERIRVEAGVQEYHRHLHKLLRAGLVESKEVDGHRRYSRTGLGEEAVNAFRELERGVSQEQVGAIGEADLGPNSVRFFLRLYGDKAEANWGHVEVRFTPAEVGRLSLFLPRIIDGVSAVDKLSEAGLVAYRDDGYIYMHAVKARAFYRYLRGLYSIVRANARNHGGNPRNSQAAPLTG
jgi:DNA-binding transcriptional ArsR family regulator